MTISGQLTFGRLSLHHFGATVEQAHIESWDYYVGNIKKDPAQSQEMFRDKLMFRGMGLLER